MLTKDPEHKKSHLIHPYNKESKTYIRKTSHLNFVRRRALNCMMRHVETNYKGLDNSLDFEFTDLGNTNAHVHNLFVTD